MPDFALTTDEARDIAAYVLTTPLAPPPPHVVPARLPLLDRKVGFDEVSAKVFRRTCWHCHGEPDYAAGDGGPGNTGGFGFKPRGASFVDYGSVAAGWVDDKGERHSLFEKTKDGTPRLLAALLARQAEEAGHRTRRSAACRSGTRRSRRRTSSSWRAGSIKAARADLRHGTLTSRPARQGGAERGSSVVPEHSAKHVAFGICSVSWARRLSACSAVTPSTARSPRAGWRRCTSGASSGPSGSRARSRSSGSTRSSPRTPSSSRCSSTRRASRRASATRTSCRRSTSSRPRASSSS